MGKIKKDVQINLLGQAFEESRYHRSFHHVLFNFIITLYTALLGFQIANPFTKGEINIFLFLLVIVVFYLILPSYFGALIYKYHITIGELNALINRVIENLLSKKGENFDFDKAVMNIPPACLKSFSFYKYKTAIEGAEKGDLKKRLLKTGRGHKFFLRVFILLVLINITFSIVNYFF